MKEGSHGAPRHGTVTDSAVDEVAGTGGGLVLASIDDRYSIVLGMTIFLLFSQALFYHPLLPKEQHRHMLSSNIHTYITIASRMTYLPTYLLT